MAVTLNISLSEEQASWIKARKENGDFASVSDVIRDLVRRERERELATLREEFEAMDKRDGVPGPEPVDEVLAICKKVRRRLLAKHETKRGS